MVVTESEIGEVESALQEVDQQQKNHPFSSLGRQSSIYSLTLDEFQHTLCESGKNFGSMNMDEFLTSIWNAEENQAINSNNQNNNNNTPIKQPTFGEMTLEDFLIKAGVVREQNMPPSAAPPLPPPQPQYGLYQTSTTNNPPVGQGFVPRPIMAMGSNGGGFGGNAYQTMAATGGVMGDSSGYQVAPPQPAAVCYNGKVAAGGGYAPGPGMGVVPPMSPVSSEGMCNSQVDNAANQFGMDLGLRGRKRIIDGPIEKVVERRQRRMIKNRESAARSRARKQAYTVELEAELNQLKQENAQLKQALAELERKRKQQYFEEWKMKTQTKAQKAKEKLRALAMDALRLVK
ncbi:hypothetical protein COLO4_29760 [Corchorus olitorius]|uniref:BZIP domain-containing protein n=1 Tax=Corchorus olitorius TaxID=93759 RepID=A0A1R3HDG9_9ROSI|nr:hypothetical protein COLO4_29760 [Corchorus olitorius]